MHQIKDIIKKSYSPDSSFTLSLVDTIPDICFNVSLKNSYLSNNLAKYAPKKIAPLNKIMLKRSDYYIKHKFD